MPVRRIHDRVSVIFDLDGTLTDSKPGILNCLGKALAASKIAWDGPLDWFIGPPVEQSIARLLPHADEAARTALMDHYRACYDKTGWAENTVYPGIVELLDALRERGAQLFVCTSKRESFALRILEVFGLAPHFVAVYADRGVKPHSKVDLLATLIHEQGVDPANAFMVGDRKYDLEAANANGIKAVAVAWGYGSAEELRAGKPFAVCDTPEEVTRLVLGEQVEDEALQPVATPLSSST